VKQKRELEIRLARELSFQKSLWVFKVERDLNVSDQAKI
jgi:hypothetical protein